jgi:hypothetical protein
LVVEALYLALQVWSQAFLPDRQGVNLEERVEVGFPLYLLTIVVITPIIEAWQDEKRHPGHASFHAVWSRKRI